MRYLVDFYYSGSNRILALAALNKLYPRYSLKRKIVYLINAANQLILRHAPKPILGIRDIIDGMPAVVTNRVLAVLLHKIEQNGRVYAFELDGMGELLAVTKIALTDSARQGVVREHSVLLKLASYKLPFQVPHVISFRELKRGCSLCMSATHQGFVIHDKAEGLPSAIYDAIASLRPIDAPKVLPRSAFIWFDSVLQRVANPVISEIAHKIPNECLFPVCAAHCDLGSENIFSSAKFGDGTQIFAVIDWESFTETAPAMTDRVAYWLGQHHRDFKRDFGRWDGNVAAANFFNAFRDAPGGLPGATLALLGLLDMGNDLAEKLCGVTK